MVRSMQHQRIKALAEPDIDYEAMEREAKRAAGELRAWPGTREC